MAKYALIKGSVVVNIVVADADWIAAATGDYDDAILCTPGVSYTIGAPLVPLPVDLATLKATRFSEIDDRTEALIAAGFMYSGHRLSLSAHAQSYWNGLGNLASNGLLQPSDFPLVVNSLDDSDQPYTITDTADAVMVFATAAATMKMHLASGTALKTAIRAASTPDECRSVIDTR